MVDHATFWKRWEGPETMYAMTKRTLYGAFLKEGRKKIYMVAEYGDNVLISNKEIKP
jgi:hypothetical protein